MNSIARWLKAALTSIVLVAGWNCVAAQTAPSAESQKASPCAAPEYRQFDFWLGDWSVYAINTTTVAAYVRVKSILDGCVLHEQYDGADGHKGESFSSYDAIRKIWQQSWVTNRGELLVIQGHRKDGAMVLTGADRTADGKQRLVRGVWKPIELGVRETAERSTDGGKTWKPWFDLVFRKTLSNGPSSDIGALASLDAEHQAAVKTNDVAVMDRILADDFVLVTGSGETYTKADLLKQARSGRMHYEHQDDTEPTVRVWGDTAVITAQLWEKGTNDGKPFDLTVRFSDTYVRTPAGWRYVFGQSSLPLPKTVE